MYLNYDLCGNQHFLIFPQCFQEFSVSLSLKSISSLSHNIFKKPAFPMSSKPGLYGKELSTKVCKQERPDGNKEDFFFPFSTIFLPFLIKNLLCFTLTLSQTSPGFYVSIVQVFRKHCGKSRNCLLQAISTFPTVFLPFWRTLCLF